MADTDLESAGTEGNGEPLPMPPKMVKALKRIAKRTAPEVVAARRNKQVRRSKPKGWLHECAEAQNWRCAYCRKSMRKKERADKPWLTATLDHVLPISRGGRNQRSNLVAACKGCNQAKGAMTAEEYAAHLDHVIDPARLNAHPDCKGLG